MSKDELGFGAVAREEMAILTYSKAICIILVLGLYICEVGQQKRSGREHKEKGNVYCTTSSSSSSDKSEGIY